MPAGMTRPPRLVMTADAVGGVWTYAIDLAGALCATGVDVTLVVLGPAPSSAQIQQAKTLGAGVAHLEGPLDWTAANEAALAPLGQAVAELADDVDADLLHLNSPSLAALMRSDRPVLGACHSCTASWWAAVRGGELPADFAWRRDLLGRGYAACDALVAPSDAFARETERLYAVRPATVRNGRQAAPSCAGGKAERFALTAGRLWDEGKNAATLDRAAARMRHRVVALGDVIGPGGAGFRPTHLEAPGRQDSAGVASWLARAPVFASPALYEPFGLAVLEAAQAGSALILSDIATFRELWDGAAVFVPPRVASAWARALDWLLDDDETRAGLAERAIQRARRYTAEAMAAGTLVAYSRLSPAFRQPSARPGGALAAFKTVEGRAQRAPIAGAAA